METDVTRSWRTVALIALLAILPYLNALAGGFTLDDFPTIRNNPLVTNGIDVIGILASPLPPMENLYRPFTVWTYALNEHLGPGQALSFHAVNIVLHATATALVFWMGMWLFQSLRVAAIAAVLFALHPIHTEAVTNIVGRAELLVAVLGLIALLSAAEVDRAEQAWSRWACEALSLTAYTLALFSKESAVTLLPLLLLFRITCRHEPLAEGLAREVRLLVWVPYAACTTLFILARAYIVGTVALGSNLTPLDNALAFVPWDVRVRSALGVFWDYFGLLHFPFVLSADYSYNQVPLVTSWFDARFLAGVLLLLAAIVALLARLPSPIKFAAVFPFIALSLTANLLFPIGTIKGERLLYLPSVGWALTIAYAFDSILRVRRYRAAALATLGLVVATFAARTWVRNRDWKNNATLYESQARSAPNSAKARYNFGIALQQRGDLTAADAEFRRALEIMPKTEGAALSIGINLELRDRKEEAAVWYRKALDIDPAYALAHKGLCRVFLRTEQYAATETACRNGLRYTPADAELLKGVGAALVGQGQADKGLEVLRRSLALNTNDHELEIYVAQLERVPTNANGEAVRVE